MTSSQVTFIDFPMQESHHIDPQEIETLFRQRFNVIMIDIHKNCVRYERLCITLIFLYSMDKLKRHLAIETSQ